MTTPTVEYIKDIILLFVQDLCIGEENKRRAVVTVSEALTVYSQSRFEAGVKAERERIIAKLDNPRLVADNGDFDAITANEVWDKVFREGIIDSILDK